jgi:hypothetical protein
MVFVALQPLVHYKGDIRCTKLVVVAIRLAGTGRNKNDVCLSCVVNNNQRKMALFPDFNSAKAKMPSTKHCAHPNSLRANGPAFLQTR